MTTAVVLALLSVAVVTLDGSRAAFSATTTNGPNRVSAGTVDVDADHAATVLFDLDRMTPGTTESRCTRVRYTGTASADVRLHATASGPLAPSIDVVVDIGRGDGADAPAGCDAFETAAVTFRGTLEQLAQRHGSFRTGVGGFERARPGAERRYRITTTLRDDPVSPAPQATAATADLTWEAAP